MRFVENLERLSFIRSKNREIKAEIVASLKIMIENYKNINQILTINKDKIWKRIINISLLNEDFIFLSTKINRLGETLDNISTRATSSDIHDIKSQINILKKKSDNLLSEISSIHQTQQMQ